MVCDLFNIFHLPHSIFLPVFSILMPFHILSFLFTASVTQLMPKIRTKWPLFQLTAPQFNWKICMHRRRIHVRHVRCNTINNIIISSSNHSATRIPSENLCRTSHSHQQPAPPQRWQRFHSVAALIIRRCFGSRPVRPTNNRVVPIRMQQQQRPHHRHRQRQCDAYTSKRPNSAETRKIV